MATNRDYTGLERTPSSMAWFIQKRAKILGIIEHKQGRIRAGRKSVSLYKKQLKAIDIVIRLHEVAVNPDMVMPVQPRRARISRRGEMGRFLIEELKTATGTTVAATELSIRFLKHLGMEVTMRSLKDMRARVAWRLKDLASEGRVVPMHVPDSTGRVIEGYWSLSWIDPED
jgi:hypothetical protein